MTLEKPCDYRSLSLTDNKNNLVWWESLCSFKFYLNVDILIHTSSLIIRFGKSYVNSGYDWGGFQESKRGFQNRKNGFSKLKILSNSLMLKSNTKRLFYFWPRLAVQGTKFGFGISYMKVLWFFSVAYLFRYMLNHYRIKTCIRLDKKHTNKIVPWYYLYSSA